MKNKIFIVIMLMLLFGIAASVNAQMLIRDTIIPPKREPVEVKQGNLRYLLFDNNRYERLETKTLESTGKTYERFYTDFSKEHIKNVIKPLIRSVFSEERAKQLVGLKLSCAIAFSPVENKMLHFSFFIFGKDNESFPLKLEELDRLEKAFRSEPKLIPFTGYGAIINHGERIHIPMNFDSLYE